MPTFTHLILLPDPDPATLPIPDPVDPAPLAPALEAVDDRPRELMWNFGLLALEVLQGRRPGSHLVRMLDDEATTAIGIWAREPIWQRAHLGSARACLLAPTVIEGCVRMDLAARSLMVTLRLERRRGRWICTAFAPLRSRGMSRSLAA